MSNINQGCINKQSGQLPDSWFIFKANYEPTLRKMLGKCLKTFGYKHWQSHKLWLSLSCSTSTMQWYAGAQWAKRDCISLNSKLRDNIKPDGREQPLSGLMAEGLCLGWSTNITSAWSQIWVRLNIHLMMTTDFCTIILLGFNIPTAEKHIP